MSWNPYTLFGDILASLGEIKVFILKALSSLSRIEAKMAAADDALKALTDVTTRTSTDVQAILSRLANMGVSQAQLDLITKATTALSAQDDAIEKALAGTPTPTATAAPGQPGQPQTTRLPAP